MRLRRNHLILCLWLIFIMFLLVHNNSSNSFSANYVFGNPSIFVDTLVTASPMDNFTETKVRRNPS